MGKVNNQKSPEVLENDRIRLLGIVVVGKISSCKELN